MLGMRNISVANAAKEAIARVVLNSEGLRALVGVEGLQTLARRTQGPESGAWNVNIGRARSYASLPPHTVGANARMLPGALLLKAREGLRLRERCFRLQQSGD